MRSASSPPTNTCARPGANRGVAFRVPGAQVGLSRVLDVSCRPTATPWDRVAHQISSLYIFYSAHMFGQSYFLGAYVLVVLILCLDLMYRHGIRCASCCVAIVDWRTRSVR